MNTTDILAIGAVFAFFAGAIYLDQKRGYIPRRSR